jgi:uncharacterized protein YndB with AHSA1/START domain
MVEPTADATPTPPAVRVSRRIKASRQRVYRAWTDPELLMRWFVEGDGEMVVRELDLRAGGRYLLEGRDRGRLWRIEGRYLEVASPSKLVYTWSWDNEPGLGDKVGRDTLVTVEFLERGAETEVVVTHERLATERARADHGAGWIGCLDRLGSLVEKE